MRFVLSFGIFILLSTSALAAPWDIVPLADTDNKAALAIRPVQMQRGGSSNELQTIAGLELNIVVTGLGDISAITRGADGTLFTADQKSGRIWSLPDRRQDGKIDIRRPLPFTFDKPSGLTVIGDAIYVADQNAVWVINSGQEPQQLASLARANSAGGPHILLAGHDKQSLILGLTTQAQEFRLLKINKNTGEASLIGEGPGALHNLAQRDGSDIWVSSGANLGPFGSEALGLSHNQSIKALALPGQYETPLDWPAQLNDHIIAAQSGPNAMQLIAIPTEFGFISGAPRVLVDGFLTDTSRSAWGQPGSIVMDKRGLFFADPYNGTLWRLSPKPKPQPKITIVDTASLPPNPNAQPKLTPQDKTIAIESSIKGTQIDTSSTIVQPSSIIYGSKLIKDYDEKKAKEDAEKTESEPTKKRRMSRKRKQKEN